MKKIINGVVHEMTAEEVAEHQALQEMANARTASVVLREIAALEAKKTIRLIGDVVVEPEKVFNSQTGQTVKQRLDEIEAEIQVLRDELAGI